MQDASLDQLHDVCGEIDEANIWRSALDAIVRHRQAFPVSVRQKFLSLWATFGGGMRTDAADDLLLIVPRNGRHRDP